MDGNILKIRFMKRGAPNKYYTILIYYADLFIYLFTLYSMKINGKKANNFHCQNFGTKRNVNLSDDWNENIPKSIETLLFGSMFLLEAIAGNAYEFVMFDFIFFLAPK